MPVSRVVAIGELAQLGGYALAGVEILDASEPGAARRAWEQLASDVGLVMLSAAAHAALADRLSERAVLWVIVPT